MLIAVFANKSDPGEIRFITPEQFKQRFTTTRCNHEICQDEQAVWWAFNGLHGTRCTIEGIVYVRVHNECDNPLQYYKFKEPARHVGPAWCKDDCSCDGNCDGDCSSGKCHFMFLL